MMVSKTSKEDVDAEVAAKEMLVLKQIT